MVATGLTISEAIELYKKYRCNRNLLQNEKRYVMEAYWKYCEKEKYDAITYQDWIFNYYFSYFEASDSKNPNILELDTVSEANKVDLSVYRWCERMSAKTGRYVFVLRQIKKTK